MRSLGVWVCCVALLVPGVARAGCPSLCEISEASFTLEPELPCAVVSARSSDCDCGVSVSVDNDCALALQALSFSFRSCGSLGGPVTNDCREVEVSDRGTFEIPIHEIGRTESSFTLRHAEQDHVLAVSADVSSFDDGAICSVGGRPGGGGMPASLAFACAGLVALVARRARRT
jgi:hypothetical protein